MQNLRYRQVHLDFHTSPAIEGVGESFDKRQWQEALKAGHVDSITCFATGHHGFSYYDTKVGTTHPNLSFDLLRAQFDAAKEIGVNVPIYLTAGVHNMMAEEHPEWREMGHAGQYLGWTQDLLKPGFKMLCFNTPYLDHLCEQIEEVVELFPDANGIFLDIVFQEPCCCRWCMESMRNNGLDPAKAADRVAHSKRVLKRYYERTTAAAKSRDLDMPIFHNSGHIERGNREVLEYFSHLELESLPTGGWGYDHFPVSAKYCHKLDLDFLGMTGRFHTTWGEFGGYKHPNALRYECAAMLAFGAKCSIGTQLHPSGAMDMTTYKLIGSAYADVEAKEAWCVDARNVADIGLLSSESMSGLREKDGSDVVDHPEAVADVGAGRILLEGHFLFDVIDSRMDFLAYKMLVLPDDIIVDDTLKAKLDEYLENGGKLFLTGTSGLATDGSGFLFDIGAGYYGQSGYQPDYILPNTGVRPSFIESPLVMYLPSQRIKLETGESLGNVYDPYFNRTYEHFCSHQHAPARPEPSGFDCGVRNGNILYLAHPVFSIYRALGSVAYKEYIINALNLLLGGSSVEAELPSTGRINLMKQDKHDRYVLHLLYANTISRGGAMELSGGTLAGKASIEVIDELLPLHDVTVVLDVPEKIERVSCIPEGGELGFSVKGGRVEFTIPRLLCHQMVEIKVL